MFRTSFLLLFSVLLFDTTIGDSENGGISEITADFIKGNSRTDAEQDPFTSVTLSGGPKSKLFSTCIATSRTIEAKFASIEVVQGSEYVRFVPDSFQSSVPVTWKSVNGSYSNILACAQAVHDAGWSMFKYNGAKCEATNMTYDLNAAPKCEVEGSDAVFILSSVVSNCPLPKFFVGNDSSGNVLCGLVSEKLMTKDEAKQFCLDAYPHEELSLFVNEYPPLTLQNVTNKFIELGYKKTNLWVDAEEPSTPRTYWGGNFRATDFWNGQLPAFVGTAPYLSAYLDKEANFKLRESDKSYKAGALCITYVSDEL